ncbi:hypothetical protein AB4Y43_01515 [Paraburkholderia sp. BR10872]|uniref:phage fiber-tail adaptor protein n=1 Tax=Paraburkholderia sp. BR10872 TaxID=3236989 RepID=UPI0034D341C1
MALLSQTIPNKDPLSTLDYAFDWSAWLATNETISTATINVPTGITLAQGASINAGVVTFWLSGGTTFNSYLIECEIQTNQGRTDSRSFQLQCMSR